MEEMEFQCDHCDAMFVAPLYGLNQTRELLSKDARGNVFVDITWAECVANFCSPACRDAGRQKVMDSHGVPIPKSPPGMKAYEKCAVCLGPIDVTVAHISFSEEEIDLTSEAPTPVDFEYLALVCAHCEPEVKLGRVHSV
jgi:hypothetical protein